MRVPSTARAELDEELEGGDQTHPSMVGPGRRAPREWALEPEAVRPRDTWNTECRREERRGPPPRGLTPADVGAAVRHAPALLPTRTRFPRGIRETPDAVPAGMRGATG